MFIKFKYNDVFHQKQADRNIYLDTRKVLSVSYNDMSEVGDDGDLSFEESYKTPVVEIVQEGTTVKNVVGCIESVVHAFNTKQDHEGCPCFLKDMIVIFHCLHRYLEIK